MRASTLRHVGVIQKQSNGKDPDSGQRVQIWTDVLIDVRLGIEPISGKEYFTKSGEQASITTRIKLRYNSKIVDDGTRYRVVSNGINYDVQSIIDQQLKRRELVLMCKSMRDG